MINKSVLVIIYKETYDRGESHILYYIWDFLRSNKVTDFEIGGASQFFFSHPQTVTEYTEIALGMGTPIKYNIISISEFVNKFDKYKNQSMCFLDKNFQYKPLDPLELRDKMDGYLVMIDIIVSN
jgi:hypothetical protein